MSTKYWMEQMGLPFHPTHVNPENQRDARHSYADLLRYPQRYRVHWQLWNGGTTRLLLWGDPDYVRRFARTRAALRRRQLRDQRDARDQDAGRAARRASRATSSTPRYRYYDYEFERYWDFYRFGAG